MKSGWKKVIRIAKDIKEDLEKAIEDVVKKEPPKPVEKDYSEVLSKADEIKEDKLQSKVEEPKKEAKDEKQTEVVPEAPEQYDSKPMYRDEPANKTAYKSKYEKEETLLPKPGEKKKETPYEVDVRLKREGTYIKNKLEHDVEMIDMAKKPDPTGDKEKKHKEKSGIPKYFGRKDY